MLNAMGLSWDQVNKLYNGEIVETREHTTSVVHRQGYDELFDRRRDSPHYDDLYQAPIIGGGSGRKVETSGNANTSFESTIYQSGAFGGNRATLAQSTLVNGASSVGATASFSNIQIQPYHLSPQGDDLIKRASFTPVTGGVSIYEPKYISGEEQGIVVLNKTQADEYFHFKEFDPKQNFDRFMDHLRHSKLDAPNLHVSRSSSHRPSFNPASSNIISSGTTTVVNQVRSNSIPHVFPTTSTTGTTILNHSSVVTSGTTIQRVSGTASGAAVVRTIGGNTTYPGAAVVGTTGLVTSSRVVHTGAENQTFGSALYQYSGTGATTVVNGTTSIPIDSRVVQSSLNATLPLRRSNYGTTAVATTSVYPNSSIVLGAQSTTGLTTNGAYTTTTSAATGFSSSARVISAQTVAPASPGKVQPIQSSRLSGSNRIQSPTTITGTTQYVSGQGSPQPTSYYQKQI